MNQDSGPSMGSHAGDGLVSSGWVHVSAQESPVSAQDSHVSDHDEPWLDHESSCCDTAVCQLISELTALCHSPSSPSLAVSYSDSILSIGKYMLIYSKLICMRMKFVFHFLSGYVHLRSFLLFFPYSPHVVDTI